MRDSVIEKRGCLKSEVCHIEHLKDGSLEIEMSSGMLEMAFDSCHPEHLRDESLEIEGSG